MSNFPIVDIIIGGILLFFIFIGTKNGFIKEISKIVALVAGFVLANQFTAFVTGALLFWIPNETVRDLTGYLLLFFLAAMLVGILAKILRKTFEIMLLGWLDRFLGLLFGLLKGFMIISLFIFILETIPASNKLHKRMVKETYLYSTCFSLKNILISYSPYENTINEFQKTIKDKIDSENLENLKKYLSQ